MLCLFLPQRRKTEFISQHNLQCVVWLGTSMVPRCVSAGDQRIQLPPDVSMFPGWPHIHPQSSTKTAEEHAGRSRPTLRRLQRHAPRKRRLHPAQQSSVMYLLCKLQNKSIHYWITITLIFSHVTSMNLLPGSTVSLQGPLTLSLERGHYEVKVCSYCTNAVLLIRQVVTHVKVCTVNLFRNK